MFEASPSGLPEVVRSVVFSHSKSEGKNQWMNCGTNESPSDRTPFSIPREPTGTFSNYSGVDIFGCKRAPVALTINFALLFTSTKHVVPLPVIPNLRPILRQNVHGTCLATIERIVKFL